MKLILNNINLSNFIQIDENIILDFEKIIMNLPRIYLLILRKRVKK